MQTKTSVFWKEISVVNAIIAAIIVSCFLFISDILNIPSYLLSKFGIAVLVVVGITVLSVAVLVMIKRKLFFLFRIPCGNALDEFLLSCIFVDAFLCFEFLLAKNTGGYKYWCILFSLIVFLGCFVARVVYCGQIKNHSVNNSNDVIDLFQFLMSPVDDGNMTPLLFSDEASQRDLLERDGLVDLLCNSIVFCRATHSFVIGVKGEWGSGKTTLLNLSKQRIRENYPEILIIDDFDPWIFGSQEAILVAMYDEVLKTIGIGLDTYSNRVMIRKIQDIVTDKYVLTGIVKDAISLDKNSYSAVKDMKNKLGVLLKQMNKSVVFVIDNIDRVEADNVLFLFRILGTLFDLPNLVFVLSYDPVRLDAIFKDAKKINPKYVEKIVQQEICIPKLSEEVFKNIVCITIEKSLLHYNVKKNEIPAFRETANLICNKVVDLRQFKRLMNSAFVTTFCYDNSLHKPYLLSIEVIRFLEPQLYEMIKSNFQFFVSRDTFGVSFVNKQKFNADGKLFFDNLFKKYEEYEAILQGMFLYVRRYLRKEDLVHEFMYDETPEEKYIASISSGKFFDLYFSFGKNDYLSIREDVCGFVKTINISSGDSLILEKTKGAILALEKDRQQEWFEQLQNQVDFIDVEKRVYVALGICNVIDFIDKEIRFAALTTDRRALVVATLLLKNSTDEIIQRFLNTISVFKNLAMLDTIFITCKNIPEQSDSIVLLKDSISDRLRNMCSQITEENIDMFDPVNYSRKNLSAMYRHFKDDTEKLRLYISRMINKKNVFKVIIELIRESTGSLGYGYEIDINEVKRLVGDREVIDDCLVEAIPCNKTEEFALMIWKRLGAKEAFYSPTPISLE